MDEYWNTEVLEFGAVNVTGFRILQPNSAEFRGFLNAWKSLDKNQWRGAGTSHLSADSALMYDGAKVILDAYNRLIKKKPDVFRNNFRRGEVYNNGTKGIDCRRVPVVGFEHGQKIAAYMKKTEIAGLTGYVAFDDLGFRRNYSIDVVEMTINSEMAKVSTICYTTTTTSSTTTTTTSTATTFTTLYTS